MRFAAAFVVAVAALSLAGCGRAGAKVQNGIEHYEHGAYEGALLKFRAMEADETTLRTKTRARYLVYRGLAHWHMKQNDDARRYLQEARKSFDGGGNPKWLPSDVREELAKAEGELGLTQPTLPGEPGTAAPRGPGSSSPDRPSPPGTPPGPPDGTPMPAPDKPSDTPAATPSSSPSSPTSSPPGPAPGQALPPSTTPPPDAM